MSIDFKEIKVDSDSDKDNWELFAEAFLTILNYKVISQPNRGRDGGVDLIVEENIENSKTIRWLVSCKNFAKSGKSVTKTHELDIYDRLINNSCNGFLAFYSTIANSSLLEPLNNLKNKGFHFKYFNKGVITSLILGNPDFDALFCSYFPNSFLLWKKNYGIPEPVLLVEYWLSEKRYHFYKETLIFLFGSISLFIKAIRDTSNINEFIKKSQLKFIKININLEIVKNSSLESLPNYLFQQANTQVIPFKLLGMGSSGKQWYLISDDFIICSHDWVKNDFQKFYNEIKKYIN